ncbi:acyltransferase [Actinokineospora sp. UTMC 2448]|uniref:acyltransferase family protein n=1 Tax=Actinokineospora sp. UTMC 2448 TaxID=2268449 RepID=UPI002164DB8D|nr:acyltransferase [Actinokineospora sp. UTMC 2448]UVS76392.1 Acyltransferase family protein [Actinokineospora sp. UTMC 2448]
MAIGGRFVAADRAQWRRASARDGFGTLRIVAAVLVIVDHCAPLTNHGGSVLPTWLGIDLGAVMVAAFMALSGYQVMGSWRRDPNLWRFTVRRLLRIMPGLAVVLLASVLVLGPIMTELSASAYFAHPNTWSYLGNNLLVFPMQYSLPGVFPGHPVPHAVNGSLWSLPVELLGYALVALFGLLGAVRRRYIVVLGAVLFAAVFERAITNQVELPRVTLEVLTLPLVQYLAIYCVGMAAYLFRVKFTWWGLLLCVGVEIVMHGSAAVEVARLVTVPYVMLTLASLMPRRLWLPPALTMASYGVYLYGFPTQQVMVYAGASTPLTVALLSVPVALVLGLLSWHIVEQPAMRLRSVLLRERKPGQDGGSTERTKLVMPASSSSSPSVSAPTALETPIRTVNRSEA